MTLVLVAVAILLVGAVASLAAPRGIVPSVAKTPSPWRACERISERSLVSFSTVEVF